MVHFSDSSQKILLYTSQDTLPQRIAKELVTFIMLCGGTLVSRLSPVWFFVSLLLWFLFLWDLGSRIFGQVYVFNSKYAMQQWLDSLNEDPKHE